MTIETELTTLNATKQAIKTAIENQGKSLDRKTFSEYAPEITAIPSCNALVTADAMAAAFRNDSTPVQTDAGDWLLLANKQPSYGDVRPAQPGVVEQSDGTTGYRDTGISLPQEGYVEIDFIAVLPESNWGYMLIQPGGEYYFNIIIADNLIRLNSGTAAADAITANLLHATKYKLRVVYNSSLITTYLNGNQTDQRAPNHIPFIDPTKTVKINDGITGHKNNQKTISVEIGDANGTPLHRWTAGNMYYDQIGNAAAVAHGTLTQLSDPLGDQTFNERGYRVNGNELIPAKLDGTAAADGQPLTYSGRAPHSVLLPNYSGSGPITNELMQFTDDGPLDQYLAGSGTENGQQFTFANVTDTANVITTSKGFSVWKTAPSVQSILEEICK